MEQDALGLHVHPLRKTVEVLSLSDLRTLRVEAKMRIVYIAHPIRGDVEDNLQKVRDIVMACHTKDTYPIAPYWMMLTYMDEGHLPTRKLGVACNAQYFVKKFVDELWLFGDHISNGMWDEVFLAQKYDIKVVAMTIGTQRDYQAGRERG